MRLNLSPISTFSYRSRPMKAGAVLNRKTRRLDHSGADRPHH